MAESYSSSKTSRLWIRMGINWYIKWITFGAFKPPIFIHSFHTPS